MNFLRNNHWQMANLQFYRQRLCKGYIHFIYKHVRHTGVILILWSGQWPQQKTKVPRMTDLHTSLRVDVLSVALKVGCCSTQSGLTSFFSSSPAWPVQIKSRNLDATRRSTCTLYARAGCLIHLEQQIEVALLLISQIAVSALYGSLVHSKISWWCTCSLVSSVMEQFSYSSSFTVLKHVEVKRFPWICSPELQVSVCKTQLIT